MYKLLKSEEKELDNYWKFINFFHKDLKNKDIQKKDFLYDCTDYRLKLIKNIRKTYTIDEFYKYEKILNKLLHNLIKYLKININDIKYNDDNCKIYEIYKKLSFSHKQYLYNEKLNKHYYFSKYQYINKFKIINKLFYILSDRNIYDKIMHNKKYIYKIKPITYYYPLDYPFPNINLLYYNENNKVDWYARIKKLYFITTNNNIDKEWYNFRFN